MSRQCAVCDDATLDVKECLVTEWFAGIMRISIFIISSRRPYETRWVMEERSVDSLWDEFGTLSDQDSARVGRILW